MLFAIFRMMSNTRQRLPNIEFDEAPMTFQGLGLHRGLKLLVWRLRQTPCRSVARPLHVDHPVRPDRRFVHVVVVVPGSTSYSRRPVLENARSLSPAKMISPLANMGRPHRSTETAAPVVERACHAIQCWRGGCPMEPTTVVEHRLPEVAAPPLPGRRHQAPRDSRSRARRWIHRVRR